MAHCCLYCHCDHASSRLCCCACSGHARYCCHWAAVASPVTPQKYTPCYTAGIARKVARSRGGMLPSCIYLRVVSVMLTRSSFFLTYRSRMAACCGFYTVLRDPRCRQTEELAQAVAVSEGSSRYAASGRREEVEEQPGRCAWRECAASPLCATIEAEINRRSIGELQATREQRARMDRLGSV